MLNVLVTELNKRQQIKQYHSVTRQANWKVHTMKQKTSVVKRTFYFNLKRWESTVNANK